MSVPGSPPYEVSLRVLQNVLPVFPSWLNLHLGDEEPYYRF